MLPLKETETKRDRELEALLFGVLEVPRSVVGRSIHHADEFFVVFLKKCQDLGCIKMRPIPFKPNSHCYPPTVLPYDAVKSELLTMYLNTLSSLSSSHSVIIQALRHFQIISPQRVLPLQISRNLSFT